MTDAMLAVLTAPFPIFALTLMVGAMIVAARFERRPRP